MREILTRTKDPHIIPRANDEMTEARRIARTKNIQSGKELSKLSHKFGQENPQTKTMRKI